MLHDGVALGVPCVLQGRAVGHQAIAVPPTDVSRGDAEDGAAQGQVGASGGHALSPVAYAGRGLRRRREVLGRRRRGRRWSRSRRRQ
jgi:hypothetical protein